MTGYIGLLRGINVGGNKMVAMADLRELLTKLGFADVQTVPERQRRLPRRRQASGEAGERA